MTMSATKNPRPTPDRGWRFPGTRFGEGVTLARNSQRLRCLLLNKEQSIGTGQASRPKNKDLLAHGVAAAWKGPEPGRPRRQRLCSLSHFSR